MASLRVARLSLPVVDDSGVDRVDGLVPLASDESAIFKRRLEGSQVTFVKSHD